MQECETHFVRIVKRTHAATQMKRVQRGRSAASTFGSLAQVWDAESQRSPRGKRGKANMYTQKRTYAAPPTPFPASLRPPSESPARNAQSQSEPTKLDNRTTFENALMAIPTHAGIETQHSASRFFFPAQGKKTGVIERKTLRKKCNGKSEPIAKRRNRNASSCRQIPARTNACAGLYPAGCNLSPAHNSLSYANTPRIAASAQDNAACPLCSACRGSKWVPASLYRRPARLRPMVGQVVCYYAAASGSGHCPPGR